MSASFVILSVWMCCVSFLSCDAIKCFECNSANNSACLDMRSPRMHAAIPAVDCASAVPNAVPQNYFCRKITQTILHADKSPEVRVTRTCGWVKHKRHCYTADNKDHLETVCQCFGDMCNGAANVKVTAITAVVLTSLVVAYNNWREKV